MVIFYASSLGGSKLPGLEYADAFVHLNEDLDKWQVFLDRVNDHAGIFWMSLAPSKCKIPLQN